MSGGVRAADQETNTETHRCAMRTACIFATHQVPDALSKRIHFSLGIIGSRLDFGFMNLALALSFPPMADGLAGKSETWAELAEASETLD